MSLRLRMFEDGGDQWIDPSALSVSGGPCAEGPVIETNQRLLMNVTTLMTKCSFSLTKLYIVRTSNLQMYISIL